MGYSIKPARIRRALSEPLEHLALGVEGECTEDRNIEDALDDAAYDYAAKLKREEYPTYNMPEEALALILNLWMNPQYDMTDLGAFKAWPLWQQHCNSIHANRSQMDNELKTSSGDSINSLVRHASLFKEYLSLPQIKWAVEESTDDDLHQVEGDMRALRKLWFMFSKLLSAELPKNCRIPQDIAMRLVFGLGKVAHCVDLSLRKHGLGKEVDSVLSDVQVKVKAAFDRKFRQSQASTVALAAQI